MYYIIFYGTKTREAVVPVVFRSMVRLVVIELAVLVATIALLAAANSRHNLPQAWDLAIVGFVAIASCAGTLISRGWRVRMLLVEPGYWEAHEELFKLASQSSRYLHNTRHQCYMYVTFNLEEVGGYVIRHAMAPETHTKGRRRPLAIETCYWVLPRADSARFGVWQSGYIKKAEGRECTRRRIGRISTFGFSVWMWTRTASKRTLVHLIADIRSSVPTDLST